ncbi:YdeI/OmpD-associated family protein [Acidicapsa acidisoli]|uniref:YdeI/OmpD-associated family protein n=1 Tax=Acidicapsa acidisoli TaxID=1615681 RepID=UPI0021E0E5D6|nr:YdeI/OmpD-associated family protein [Acidicapsa acidisoli]
MTFQAVLEKIETGFSSVMARIPFDPVEVWPVRSKLRVKGSIRAANEASEPVAIATSLLRSQERGYFLLVTGKMRKAAHLTAGSLAEIVLEPDLDDRAATPPPELAKLLKSDRSVKKWYETLNYSTRKYIADMVAEPKSAEVRVRRAEQWMERIMLIMDGEESPPPILQVAFRRQPLARVGWEALTPNQRRMTLFGIFMCQSPEAQAKRTERAVEDAVKAARRSTHMAGSRNASNPED